MKEPIRISAGILSGGIAFGQNAQAVGQGGRIVNASKVIPHKQMAEELAKVRQVLLNETKSPEDYLTIGHVFAAEVAAKEANSSGVTSALSALGEGAKWVIAISQNIGANLVADFIQKQIGF